MSRIKMLASIMAATAALAGAPPVNFAQIPTATQLFGWGGGRRRRGRGYSGKNEYARRGGIPKAFRQYCRRYHGTIA